MKILFLTDLYPSREGQSRSETSYALHDLIKNRDSDFEIVVIRPVLINNPVKCFKCKITDPFVLDEIKIFDCPVIKIPKMPVFFIRDLINCLRSIKFEPDLIIAHLGFNLLIGYEISMALKVRLVSGIHMGDLVYTENMTGRKNFRKILNHSSGIICRSDLIRSKFLRKFPEYEKKVLIGFSGIRKEIVISKDLIAAKLRRWVPGPDITRRLISVCRLDKNKNVDKILRELSNISKSISWNYTVIGDGDERSMLEKLAKDLNLEGKVYFAGLVKHDEVLEKLEESDVFIMLSSIETFGIVYLEAMAKGNIVIGSKNTGIDGFISDGFNGFLSSPEFNGELKDLLEKILISTSEEELKRVLLNSYEKILKYTEKSASENYFRNIKLISGEGEG